MRESFDVVILGCGEAGIFAAYELEKLNPGLKLLAIDQGPDIYHRSCPIVSGKVRVLRSLDQAASRQVLDLLLELHRASRVALVETRRPTPLAFPLRVDRARGTVSSEGLADRIRKMQLQLERAADREAGVR